MIIGEAVVWYGPQQEVMSLSLTEAQYITLFVGINKVACIHRLVQGLRVVENSEAAASALVDNQGFTDLETNVSINRCANHIDVRHHCSRQNVTDGIVRL